MWDTNPHLYDLLAQFPPKGFAEETFFGSHCCGGWYFVIEAYFVDAEIEQEPQIYFFDEYLENLSAKNFVAEYQTQSSIIPAQWIVTQAPSPKGNIHRSLLGPFVAEGYIWEYACVMLLKLWSELHLLVKASNMLN